MHGVLTVIDPAILARIDALQTDYIAALDSQDMHAWLDCFGQEGSYVCTTLENDVQGLPLALMLDDCHARLKDRVNYITDVWVGTFEDYTTRHFVQRLKCVASGPFYEVTSNFLVTYTSARGLSDVLTAGSYRDVIAVEEAGAKFCSKKAVLDTTVTPRYLVYPV